MITNPIEWSNRRFLIIATAVLFGFLGTLSADAIRVEGLFFLYQVARVVLGFCLVTLIPGATLLRLLEFRNVRSIDRFLFAIGCSLALSMCIFLALNFGGLLLGITDPLTSMNIIISLIITTGFLLGMLAYRSDLSPANAGRITLSSREKLTLSYTLIVFVLTIVATLMVNRYGSTEVMKIVIISITIFPVIFLLWKPSHQSFPYVALYFIALSLLLHITLISPYIQGRDIQIEYYFAKQVIEDNWWDHTVAHPYNSVVSVVGLIPLYTFVTDLEPTWVMKIFIPSLFALVPVGLYSLITHELQRRIDARYAIFLFIFLGPFFYVSVSLVRQEIAVLFLVLSLLAVFGTDDHSARWLLAAIFFVAMALSHYGTGYMFVAFIFPIVALRIADTYTDILNTRWKVPVPAVMILFGIVIVWYSTVAGSTLTNNIISILGKVIERVGSGPLIELPRGLAGEDITTPSPSDQQNPTNTPTPTESDTPTPAAGGGIQSPTSPNEISKLPLIGSVVLPTEPFRFVTKSLYAIFFGFISLGLLRETVALLLGRDRLVQDTEFVALGVIVYGFFISRLILPFFGLSLARFIFLSFLFLVPYLFRGVESVFDIFLRFNISLDRYQLASVSLTLLLIPFLLLTSGFLYDLSENSPKSPALSQETIHSQSLPEKYNFYNFYSIHASNVNGANWLRDRTPFPEAPTRMYYTGLSAKTLEGYGGGGPEVTLWFDDSERFKHIDPLNTKFQPNSYIYITYVNTKENLLSIRRFSGIKIFKYQIVEHKVSENSKVYTNGHTQVYRVGSDLDRINTTESDLSSKFYKSYD